MSNFKELFTESVTESTENELTQGLKNLGFKKVKGRFGLDVYEDKSENKVFVDVDTGKIEDTDIDDKKLEKKVKAL